MMTKVGKLLVFVNLFVSVALLTWALTAYTNQMDWAKKPATGGPAAADEDPFADDTNNLDRLQAKISKLSETIGKVQGTYMKTSAATTQEELIRDYRQSRYVVRLNDARNGAFKVQVNLPKSSLVDVTNDQGAVVTGVDTKPLKGLDAVQGGLDTAVKGAIAATDNSAKSRTQYKSLTEEIDVQEQKIAKRKDILVQLIDENAYLADRRTDWDEQVRTLVKRKGQVAVRMNSLGK